MEIVLNTLTLTGDLDIISSYQYITQVSDKNDEKYKLGDYWLI